VQVTKNLQFGGSTSMYVRLDVLNVFNWANFSDYELNFIQNGAFVVDPVRFNTVGNIAGVPRTFKATMGFRF
jgi:hypothetical protein